MLKRFTFCLIVLCLFSCSSKDEKSEKLKPADLVDFDASVKMKLNWSSGVGKGQGKRYSRFVPAIVGDAIYIADVKGNVFALNINNGKKLWKKDTKFQIGGAIGASDDALYFGTYDGEVVALDRSNGAQRWFAKTSSEVVAAPASDGRVVVAQTIDGRVYAFNQSDGAELWRYDHAVPVLTLRGTSTPVISRSQVVVAFDNGQILSLNLADGSLQWSGRVSQPSGRTDLEKMVDIDGTPVIENGLVYAASYHGAVVAFSRQQGQAIWKQDVSTAQNLAVSSDLVVAVDENSHVVAFGASSGDIVWRNDALHRRNAAAPAIIGDYVALIDEDDYLHLLSLKDGSFAYRFKPKGDDFRSPPLAYAGGLLTLSADGKLSSYRLAELK